MSLRHRNGRIRNQRNQKQTKTKPENEKQKADQRNKTSKNSNQRQIRLKGAWTLLRECFRGTFGQVMKRKRRTKSYGDKLMTLSLSKAFIVFAGSSLRLI
jgi:hypothetical protein